MGPNNSKPTGHGASTLLDEQRAIKYEDMIRKICDRIDVGFRRRDEAFLLTLFTEHSEHGMMDQGKVFEALEEAGCDIERSQLNELLLTIDADNNSGLNFEQFRRLTVTPTPIEQWALSLPVAKIISDAIYPLTKDGIDPLRKLSLLGDSEVAAVSVGLESGLRRMFQDECKKLKSSFSAMDQNSGIGGVRGKFQSSMKMSCGGVDDYHSGVEGRTGFMLHQCCLCILLNDLAGTPFIEFMQGMNSEHCSKGGCDTPFTSTNYNITTTPAKEWKYIVDRLPCPDLQHDRNIPDIDELLQKEVVIDANLSRPEIVAIVLYTGPMFQIYNSILRRWPEKVYEFFNERRNCFSTTIFVLVSAVQKLSRSVKMPNGLLLYRGLGGTLDMPESFYRSNKSGCCGYAEWGFMSTTSDRRVALQYSGVKEGKACATVLVIKVGGVDRGACVRDLSQYASEVEYIWLPCSWVEQGDAVSYEVTPHGLVRLIPCNVRANMKSMTTEELVERKKRMHLTTFQYLADDLQIRLTALAADGDAEGRLLRDESRFLSSDTVKAGEWSVKGFLGRIMGEVDMVIEAQREATIGDYTDDGRYWALERGMSEIIHMAMSKLQYWMETSAPSIRFIYDESCSTVHRLRLATLEKAMAGLADGPERTAMAVTLCKVRELFHSGPDEINGAGETSLTAAAGGGRSAADLRLLLAAGVDLNRGSNDGSTALQVAANAGNVENVRMLIEFGADVNVRTKFFHGSTAIFIAALQGHPECVEALVQAGADVHVPNVFGTTPLWICANVGYDECMGVLIKAGADPNQQDPGVGSWPVCRAAQRGYAQCVRRLIEAGAEVNWLDKDATSALWWAADGGFTECIEALLAAKADVGYVCQGGGWGGGGRAEGSTALERAEAKGHEACAHLLRKAPTPLVAKTGPPVVHPPPAAPPPTAQPSAP